MTIEKSHLAHALRFLAIDSVQAANSGHPGMPMGMADIAQVLWQDFLQHNPTDPNWINRDRFVLSNGHGVALLYALLHLSGYALTLEDLKAFRQLHSKTPGHPEYGLTPGVESTTGPLGQGIAQGVGMAIAEQTLAAQFNQPHHDIIDHHTYVFAGDGCLMEGISHEACSLAGTLKLGKLIVFWDDNGISIDGEVTPWFSEDTVARFAAYQWQVIALDGHDPAAIAKAIKQAQTTSDQPSLIACRTHIGFGSPKHVDTAHCHGSPLGADDVAATRQQLNWPHPPFEIPSEIQQAWDAKEKGQRLQAEWEKNWNRYQAAHPKLAGELIRRLSGALPKSWPLTTKKILHSTEQQAQSLATRKASQQFLDAIHSTLPELFGGSADLTPSNLTRSQHAKIRDPIHHDGDYLHYGVREFAMTAISTGIALHQGFIPFAGTFLTFIDYARNALRLAAMMQQRVIMVLTHDSIGLGEDGPTHQPIEHLAMLRATPNVTVWRPCDGTETAVAWQQAIEHTQGPTCLALSRQTLAHQPKTPAQLAAIQQGGYVLYSNEDDQHPPQAILIATGSEVALAKAAALQAKQDGYRVRVVSMPCVERFLAQPQAYQDQVLPPQISIRITLEAGSRACWHQFVGPQGLCIGLDEYGHSAPGDAVFTAMQLTSQAVYHALSQRLLAKHSLQENPDVN